MMPFISGKDSLNNEFAVPPSPSGRGAGGEGPRHIIIPPTLLISAMGQVRDVRQCVTMDMKEPGNLLFLVGTTADDMGGSLYQVVTGQAGGQVPVVDLAMAPRIFAAVHEAICTGMVRSCHDLSEGGLAVAIAEMAFAGGVGADVDKGAGGADAVRLFAESPTRFLIEVRPQNADQFRRVFDGIPLSAIGKTVKEPRLRIAGADGEWIVASLQDLKEAWQTARW